MLIPATTAPDKSYEDLADIYGQMLGQWVLELNHVAAIVGGVDSQEKYGSQNGAIFTPVAKERQVEAVRFLNEHAFTTPKWALKPEILERIEPTGALERVRTAQRRVLANLLSERRIERLIEQSAMEPKSAYSPSEFLSAVRRGIWSELEAPRVHTDAFRSNVQYIYLDLMSTKLNGPQPQSEIERSLIRSELKTLSQDILRALPRASDRETRAHLEDARDQVARALDPKFLPPAPQSGIRLVRQGVAEGDTADGIDPLRADAPLNCWPDYSIRLPNRRRHE